MLTLTNLLADVAPVTKDSSSSSTAVIIGVVVLVLALAVIGFLVARRRKNS